MEHSFLGKHILSELYGVSREKLNNIYYIGKIIKKAAEVSGAQLLSIQKEKFEPMGVSVIGLLSESHISIHTYPEYESLFFDMFTCGQKCNPEKSLNVLIDYLMPKTIKSNVIERGIKFEINQ